MSQDFAQHLHRTVMECARSLIAHNDEVVSSKERPATPSLTQLVEEQDGHDDRRNYRDHLSGSGASTGKGQTSLLSLLHQSPSSFISVLPSTLMFFKSAARAGEWLNSVHL